MQSGAYGKPQARGADRTPPTAPQSLRPTPIRPGGNPASEIASQAEARARVAVVIPSYNYARFLDTALRSVYAQTHAAAEIIVVDDGSTDDPAAALIDHPNVRLVRQAHRGLGAARNTGWRTATSEFVVFLDADDRLRPEALAHNLEQFRTRPECAFAYGAYCMVQESTGEITSWPVETLGDDAVASLLSGNRIGMHGAVMYRREALERLGGFDADLRACEDYDIYLKAAFAYPIACRPEILAEYVHHEQNMTRRFGMMLAYALKVLRRYRPQADHRPEWRRALRQGEIGLMYFYAQNWTAARRRPLPPGQRAALYVEGLKIAGIAPLTLAKVMMGPRIRAALGRS